MKETHVERVVNLLDPTLNRIWNMDVEEARRRLFAEDPQAVREIRGSFALLARKGKAVRMARSIDRPMRYFLAKKEEGPALFVADRIDAIHKALRREGLADQFHPSYTRMVPAHYVVEVKLVGCPDPDPTYTRYFTPQRDALPKDLDEIGRRYIGAAADEIAHWLQQIPQDAPIGVAFSGGLDSGAVFLLAYHMLRKLGMSPARLKAFTLDLGEGPDLKQAREFLEWLGLAMFHEPVQARLEEADLDATIRIVEDYKPLDIQCAAMSLVLFRKLRENYPDWRYFLDGEGGDENLKDYPIEENPELTIRSVINNLMLYHEGWGVGRIKHSLTYSGGLSRSYVRTYATARRFGFENFSPLAQTKVIEVAEGIPFAELTGYDVARLYALKGEIVSRGIRAITGMEMPVFPKRRFQHGAAPKDRLLEKLPDQEPLYRRRFLALYEQPAA